MTIETMEWYRPEEITEELLSGAVDESVPRYEQVWDYVDPHYETESEEIQIDVVIQQPDQGSQLVGFADPTPLNEGVRTQARKASPAHIKDGHGFNLKSPHLNADQANNVSISGEGIALATRMLERRRVTRITQLLVTALNEEFVSYRDTAADEAPEYVNIGVDYSSQIQQYTLAEEVTANGAKLYQLVDQLREDFYSITNMMLDVVLVSSKTYATLKAIEEFEKKIRPQTPRDPDASESLFDGAMFDDVMFVPVRRKYVKPDGSLADPIAEGKGILLSNDPLEDGMRALRWGKVGNKLNNGNPDGPAYGLWIPNTDPPSAVFKFYDNGLPLIAKRKAIGKVDLYTP